MPFDFVPLEEFFRVLYGHRSFCAGLGRVMLAAGRLETNLRAYLKLKEVTGVRTNSTLGSLVRQLKVNDLLTRNGEMHFDDLTLKRNYLAHSPYRLFSEEIEQTLLPSHELVMEDVSLFEERVNALAEDFMFFANLVSEASIAKPRLL